MGRNVFPVNTAAVNSLNQNGVAFAFPPPPPITAGWRALRHEVMIQRDGRPAVLRVLATRSAHNCYISFKGLKVDVGSTPLRTRIRRGYISPVALQRSLFYGEIKSGDVVESYGKVWSVVEAHIQNVAGEDVRWVLDLEESGTS